MYGMINHSGVDPTKVRVLGAKDPLDGFFVAWCSPGHPDEENFRSDHAGYEIVEMDCLEALSVMNDQAEVRIFQ